MKEASARQAKNPWEAIQMTTEKVFIKDIEQLREFIKLEKTKEEYFDHIMDKIMDRRAA